MLNINFVLLNKNNNCSQNEEMKAQIPDKYKGACLYCHSSYYGKMSLLSKKTSLLMQYSVYFVFIEWINKNKMSIKKKSLLLILMVLPLFILSCSDDDGKVDPMKRKTEVKKSVPLQALTN